MASAKNRRAKNPCAPDAHQSAEGVASDDGVEEGAIRSKAVIRAELRELAAKFLPADDLAWFRENFPNVWPRGMEQLELFR